MTDALALEHRDLAGITLAQYECIRDALKEWLDRAVPGKDTYRTRETKSALLKINRLLAKNRR